MTATVNWHPNSVNEWKRILRKAAQGLDFETAEGREQFRLNVSRTAEHTRVDFLRYLVRELGHGSADTSRGGVLRQLADWWMLLPERQRIPADEIATDEQRRELANSIAQVAEAITEGRVQGPLYAAVQQLEDMVATLKVWTPDDRT